MTDKHDKLVEMALKSGAVNHFVQGLPDRYAFSLNELTAFADAHVASLCADVEPFWHAVISHRAPIVNKAVRSRDVAEEYAEKCSENYPGVEVIPLVPASTVAAITAQRDAALSRATDWKRLYDRAINEANGLTNYVEDRPELRSAERRLDVIYADARALKGQP